MSSPATTSSASVNMDEAVAAITTVSALYLEHAAPGLTPPRRRAAGFAKFPVEKSLVPPKPPIHARKMTRDATGEQP
jgi:hypothetical protein